MKLTYIGIAAIAATALYTWAEAPAGKLPAGWELAGDTPKSYSAFFDSHTTLTGKGSGSLRYETGDKNGFGTLMTDFSPKAYRGKRVRLTGWLKFDKVSDWTGMWMRADVHRRMDAFYNSEDLHLNGSRDWQPYSVVLDIPADATNLAYGVILSGTGQVWMEKMSLEVVGKDVPLSVQAEEARSDTTPHLL